MHVHTENIIKKYGAVSHECCKAIIQSGVWRVVSPKFTDHATELRWKESCEKTIKLFREAGVEYDFI